MQNVSTLEEARAALAAGELALESPPFAACHAGVGYYHAILKLLVAENPGVHFTFTLCCGGDAALAYEALQMGFTHVRCDPPSAQAAALRQAAHAAGAHILIVGETAA